MGVRDSRSGACCCADDVKDGQLEALDAISVSRAAYEGLDEQFVAKPVQLYLTPDVRHLLTGLKERQERGPPAQLPVAKDTTGAEKGATGNDQTHCLVSGSRTADTHERAEEHPESSDIHVGESAEATSDTEQVQPCAPTGSPTLLVGVAAEATGDTEQVHSCTATDQTALVEATVEAADDRQQDTVDGAGKIDAGVGSTEDFQLDVQGRREHRCVVGKSRDVPHEFNVTLTKTPEAQSLGVAVDVSSGQYLIIDAVEDAGLVAAWNVENPDKEVKAGDKVMEVNGSKGSAAQMAEVCASDDTLHMHILRNFRYGASTFVKF